MAARDFQKVIQSPSQTYQEGLAFFMGKGIINNVLQRLALALEKLGIDYNIIGAIALNQHGYKRFTEDIDLLLTKEGLEKFGAVPLSRESVFDLKSAHQPERNDAQWKLKVAGVTTSRASMSATSAAATARFTATQRGAFTAQPVIALSVQTRVRFLQR